MDTRKIITELRETVEQLDKQGTTAIDSRWLASLLREWETQISTQSTVTEEQRKHELEVWKVQAASTSANGVEMFKSVIEAGQTALRSAMLINAGAAAALLALLAETLKASFTSGMGVILSPLALAWLAFMIGMASAGLATAARYISQALYATSSREVSDNDKKSRIYKYGDWGRNVAVILAFASFGAFIYGSAGVYTVVQDRARTMPQFVPAPPAIKS